MALDGRQSMNLHTTTNKTQSAAMEGTKDGRRDEREARGKRSGEDFTVAHHGGVVCGGNAKKRTIPT
jgi:hypothetical protein